MEESASLHHTPCHMGPGDETPFLMMLILYPNCRPSVNIHSVIVGFGGCKKGTGQYPSVHARWILRVCMCMLGSVVKFTASETKTSA